MDANTTVSNAELEILETLWSAGRPLNAGEIRNFLNENRKWERTTVLTLIQRLLKKGVISQEKKEVYYYAPCVKRSDYVNAEMKSFVNKFFHNSPGAERHLGTPHFRGAYWSCIGEQE